MSISSSSPLKEWNAVDLLGGPTWKVDLHLITRVILQSKC